MKLLLAIKRSLNNYGTVQITNVSSRDQWGNESQNGAVGVPMATAEDGRSIDVLVVDVVAAFELEG